LPRQNRPVVRDGRLQVKKKRTDRSYLRPEAPAPESPAEPEPATKMPVAEAETIVEAEREDPLGAVAPPSAPHESPVAPASRPSPTRSTATRTGGAARALQQQGVRRRREVDVDSLLRRDSSYAMHELRRIGALTVMVVTTLIVLGVFLR
jgi:hypothetical protein